MMLAALGETRQAIEVANSALDHQQTIGAMVPVHAGHAKSASGSRLRSAWPRAWASSNIGARRANDPTSAPIRQPEANAAPNCWLR